MKMSITRVKDAFKKYKVLVYVALYLMLTVLILNIFIESYTELRALDFSAMEFDIEYLFFYILVTVIALLLFALSWHYCLKAFGVHTSLKSNVLIYLQSQKGKYIPGKIALIAIKINKSRKLGVPLNEASFASAFELGVQMYVMLIIGGFSIVYLANSGMNLIEDNYWVPLVGLAFLVPFIFHPSVFRFVVKSIYRILGKEMPSFSFDIKHFVVVLLIKLVGTVLNGFGLFLIINVFYPIETREVLFVISSSSLGFLIGLISVFAPSGVGVRETALIYILKTIIPVSICLASTLLLRVALLVVEIIVIVIAHLIPLNRNEITTYGKKYI